MKKLITIIIVISIISVYYIVQMPLKKYKDGSLETESITNSYNTLKITTCLYSKQNHNWKVNKKTQSSSIVWDEINVVSDLPKGLKTYVDDDGVNYIKNGLHKDVDDTYEWYEVCRTK